MSLLSNLSCLALKGVAVAAGEVVGVKVVGEAGDAVAGLLYKHFSDHSQRLTRALQRANERAWKALEIALAGDSWWERCKVRLASGAEKGFRQQVQTFLDAVPLTGSAGQHGQLRQDCLRQLQAARQAGVLLGGSLAPEKLARQAGALARFADPAALVEAEWRTLDQMADELREKGYPALARLLSVQPPQGPPLLVAAARYFFRREMETDRELFQGMAFARLEELSQGQTAGFAALTEALEQHGRRLEELLDDVRSVVVETRADVLDIKEELHRQGQQMQELGQAVLQALAQHQLERRQLTPGDSLSIRGDAERQMVKALIARYRALPAEQRRTQPALLNAIGKLEVVAGDFEAARRDFGEVAGLVGDSSARAEAHANAFQAALEERRWPEALAALSQAATLDPERFAPFPLSKFEPERILGAGGFGVAFLCRNRHSGSRVVIKTLRGDTLDRDLGEVFREAQVLEELDHPAIIRVRDCDFADAGRTRPYVVMDYFPGQTLADYVEQHGVVPVKELLPLAGQVAEGLQAAHGKGILHRDVKPANLLVRREGASWQVKLIDFGLALRGSVLQSTARGQGDRTLSGSSVAGTLDYAPPEQMGRLKDVPVSACSDVYGFARTCCFALFGTPQPTFQHWQKLPKPLAELLGQCLAEVPKDRPASVAVVRQRLARLAGPAPSAAPQVVVAVAEEEPEIRDVLPVVEPARPARPAPSRSTRRKPREEPQQSSVLLWVALLVLIVVGGLGVGFYALSSLLRPGGNPHSRVGGLAFDPFGQKAVNKPAEPLTAQELPVVLQQWDAADTNRKQEIARQLAVTPVKQEYREQVVKDLESLVFRPTLGPKVQTEQKALLDNPYPPAIEGLGVWGGKEHVPALIRLVTTGHKARGEAMKALARLQDDRAIVPIAERLTDPWDRDNSRDCLLSFGPRAEDGVLRLLEGKDHFAKRAAISILQEIGGEKSIEPLEKASKDLSLKGPAEGALRAIKARLQK